MKLAVSNIGWSADRDGEVAATLVGLGVRGIEVAPTKAWPTPLDATPAQVDAYRRWWNDRGLEIVAAQALLFGRPELVLFGGPEARAATTEYLKRIIDLCARLGAGALVFGSPKNRRRGDLPAADARAVAIDFFRGLAEHAHAGGTALVLEANPPEYGADFVTRAGEAIDLVEAVAHPGLRLHLDAACMTMAGDPIAATFDAGFPLLGHFHISEPNLAPPGSSGRVDHAAFAEELGRRGYPGWLSIEAREPSPFTLEGLAASVEWALKTYAPAARRAPG